MGVLVLDRTDRDFGFVVLGRDEKDRFRATEVEVSMSKSDARHALFKTLQRLTETGDKVFLQYDSSGDKAGVNLFSLIVNEEKMNPTFKILRDHELWMPARAIMSEMMRNFVDIDGNFVEQFQTTGFDSRIWELYLYAALLDLGLSIERSNFAPDFQVSDGLQKVFIEAVIAGPSSKDNPLPLDGRGKPSLRTDEEIKELLRTRVPIRFGSALFSKLNHEPAYWELDHVKGNPLVFAIADFHESHSMTWTSPALMEYLYGVTHDFATDSRGNLIITPLKVAVHEYKGKSIPSGFFLQDKAQHISAVLFSSSGTLSKFNRMGKLAGFGVERHRIFRSGVRHCHEQNATIPVDFFHEIAPGQVTERWSDGLSMFHNPNALNPIDPKMFPGIAHHFFKDMQVLSLLPEFHIYSSFTLNFLLTDEKLPEEFEPSLTN
ncbi:MAG: hypothetical protein HQM00_09605 [Magnetococcales bacterium]|nr:hypothetical protein [Magnetococcales bacterium]